MAMLLLIEIYSVKAQNQTAVLSEFYHATGGPTWNNPLYAAWDTATSECTWAGITCDQENRITALRVSANLTGTLPSILGDLTTLTIILLNPGAPYIQTELYGTVPAVWFTSNRQLFSLNLHGLRVTSPLPIEMGAVPLQSLDLSLTDITEVPAWIGDLRNTLTTISFNAGHVLALDLLRLSK
eukprot:TRINITY_DN4926_c1_g1_i2.p1 TRINITY_DN4926_c1_g1~~TRINITY_DN4926_c1_g1_i2.p1  ORF type:complete len:209 (-),score=0.35 TRINITY_DN4926_c1_g1_i2:111-659(-)